MGASLQAEAMSHLEEVSDAGIKAMSEAGTVAVLLPTTAHILRLTPPPARKMIEAGVPVALGSDFNPNAFCNSMVSRCSVVLKFFIILPTIIHERTILEEKKTMIFILKSCVILTTK